MLEASSITLVRGRRPILEAVSLAVRPGELVALIGPNGAGKSTLLACLAGTVQPQSGEVRLDGRRLSTFTPKELARRRAVLSQRLAVPPQLPLEDLVAFGRLPHRGRHSPQAERAILAAVIEEQGLGRLIGRTCGTLSGGELQRAHLARVTAQLRQDAPAPASYLLLDEPTANLDPAYQDLILTQARRLAETGAGVVAVLHDLNQAAQVADRLVVMAAGRVVADGPPETVLGPDLVRRVYGIGTLTVPHPRTGRPILLSDIGPPAARAVQPEARHAG